MSPNMRYVVIEDCDDEPGIFCRSQVSENWFPEYRRLKFAITAEGISTACRLMREFAAVAPRFGDILTLTTQDLPIADCIEVEVDEDDTGEQFRRGYSEFEIRHSAVSGVFARWRIVNDHTEDAILTEEFDPLTIASWINKVEEVNAA